jgi:glyoxylase-like metal-dependent hydrolase (beta-lactamase superfamily II)
MPITSSKRFSLNNLKHCFHKTKRTIARMQSTTKTTELIINDSFVIVQIPCLIDNYAFLIHCLRTKQTCALDTPELNPILSELLRRRWTLTHILNTHWHGDHTGANLQVRSKTLTLTRSRALLKREEVVFVSIDIFLPLVCSDCLLCCSMNKNS